MIATGRRIEALDSLCGDGVECLSLDVTSDASVQACVQQVLAQYNRIDVLINNAGISSVGPVAEQPISELEAVLATNVIGVVRMTQAVIPTMIEQRSGMIVNVGSVVSEMTTPWSGAYSASKAALLNLTDALRQEVAPFNIKVTYTMAGAIESAFGSNTIKSTSLDRYDSERSAYTPWVASIRARADASQSKGAMSAIKAARRVVKVVEASVVQPNQHDNPPVWFFIGGNAFIFWFLGIWQKVFGWPVNGILSRKFGLKKIEI